MNLICKTFGHRWILKPKPDILSNRRVCKRCKLQQKRILFIPKLPKTIEKWIDFPSIK